MSISKSRARSPARPRPRRTSLFAHGEAMVWLTGGALALALFMVVGLLVLVAIQGFSTFWPSPVVEVRTSDGKVYMGEVTREEAFAPTKAELASLPEAARKRAGEELEEKEAARRRLIRTGNFEIAGTHYTWVTGYTVLEETAPEWAVVIERRKGGRFYGFPVAFELDGEAIATEPPDAWALYEEHHDRVRDRRGERQDVKDAIGEIGRSEEEARLDLRQVELDVRKGSASSEELEEAREEYAKVEREAEDRSKVLRAKMRELDREDDRYRLVMQTAQGVRKNIPLAEIVRAYRPNRLGFFEKLGIYCSRWWEFLADDPREANSEGGVYPAIFGTVVMTLIMCILVVPFGVLAALYLREYAKAGPLVSVVRIAINNLAGVPSIVFGVFGLGFFCYIIGASIDDLFFEAKLPNPTYGKGGILWASLTLALLTLPVVIISTEEALAAVPSSMREGSYACGASKWQTIRRIVLPRAMPGIMTGLILAMARGAGEVAPLMLVGAVKLAPDLPIDGTAPFVHPDRSFMHLGFHIYDVGFQSQNSEAAKPMVFTTTLLLITIVVLLNVVSIRIRGRLRRRFGGGHF